jgi:hypothetical protein
MVSNKRYFSPPPQAMSSLRKYTSISAEADATRKASIKVIQRALVVEDENKKKEKTIRDLVRISTQKSRSMSGCMKLGSSDPTMKIAFPLRHIVLQNCTAAHITQMLSGAKSTSTPISTYEQYYYYYNPPQHQLPRQPATESE